jgi:adenosylcobinamide kinase/adenosylcobinamide-phosphate guanylyltransferase
MQARWRFFGPVYRLQLIALGELNQLASLANPSRHLTLVLGGARSGKSRYAEATVMATPSPWIYIATAEPFDDEMKARIAEHRGRRGRQWQTIEAPLDLANAIAAAPPAATVLVDCLTLWLNNLMFKERDIDAETERLETALGARQAPVVLVSNEVGSGIVPENAEARRFRDLQGRLNQRIAARADRVVLLVAGLPLMIKGRS